MGEDGTEQEGHDDVEQKEDAEGLHARDEVGAAVLVREEEDDERGDAADGDVCAAKVGGGNVEKCGTGVKAAQECVEDRDGTEDTEELEPLPLGEEPVVAGFFCGDDGGGFIGREVLEDNGEDERRGSEDGPGTLALAQVREAQDEHQTEGIGGHEGMEGGGEDEAERGVEKGTEVGAWPGAEVGAHVEREGHGEEGEWCGETAPGDVGVHQKERCTGDGDAPEGGEKAEAGELGDGVGDGALEKLVGGEEGEPEAEQIGEEEHPGERETGTADEEGEGGSEDREAEVFGDEDGVVRKERGVEGILDAGDVEAAVFGEGMVTIEQEGDEGERDQEEEPRRAGPGR